MFEYFPGSIEAYFYSDKFKTNRRMLYTRKDGKKFKIRWWGKDSLFQHPTMLFSAYFGITVKNSWDLRKNFEIPKKDFLLMADSGGFQSYSQGYTANPIDILRWMEHNEADIGMMLDVPPSFEESVTITKEFLDKEKQSIRNYEKAVNNRQEDKMLLYKPIQGCSLETMRHWEKATAHIDCQGYACTPKKPIPLRTAFVLSYAIDRGWENFHHFYGTGKTTVPIFCYAQQFFKKLTFDSSTYYVKATKFREYALPFTSGIHVIQFGRRYKSNLKILPCYCQVCKQIELKDILKDDMVAGALILLHNFQLFKHELEFLTKLSADKHEYREYIRKYFPKETLDAIKFIDASVDGNFEEECKKRGLTNKGAGKSVNRFI